MKYHENLVIFQVENRRNVFLNVIIIWVNGYYFGPFHSLSLIILLDFHENNLIQPKNSTQKSKLRFCFLITFSHLLEVDCSKHKINIDNEILPKLSHIKS